MHNILNILLILIRRRRSMNDRAHTFYHELLYLKKADKYCKFYISNLNEG